MLSAPSLQVLYMFYSSETISYRSLMLLFSGYFSGVIKIWFYLNSELIESTGIFDHAWVKKL